MKKLIILLIIVCGFTPVLHAVQSVDQYLSPDEFRARQQAFITERAGLTKEEAAKFFPIYFELQDRKKQLNDKAWKLLRSGKDEKNTTDSQYGKILEGVYNARIASDQLDKTYLERFKKILPYKKIFLIQKAEMRFYRELLKDVRDKERHECRRGLRK